MALGNSNYANTFASDKITYNANGGSGAPGQQTKYYGKTLKLSTTKPSRTGYTFQGWGTSASGSVVYAAGANYTANASDTLYAIWKANTWTVSYDANGGTGAPTSQTKTYGVTLTLSSTKPTRTNYNFLGWATSASSTTVAYAPGTSYTTNAAVTLYAVWELAYIAPRITNVVVGRSTSSGELSDEGTYARISFNWETDKTVSSVQIGYRLQDTGTYQYTTVSASGVSGSVDYILNGSFDAEQYYDIEILITDSLGSNNVVRVLEAMKFIIDIKSGGTGIAFNKPASLDGFDVNFESYFRKPINLIDAGGDGVDWELVPKLQELSDGVEKNADDISELNNNIIESGSNENGRWRKYGDGTIEQWGVFRGTYVCDTAGGSGYVSEEMPVLFPIDFNGEFSVVVTLVRTALDLSFPIVKAGSASTGFSVAVGALYKQNASRNGYFQWRAIST